MLIESYKLDIEVSKHSVEEFEYEAIAHISSDIREALPYLNAVLKSAMYLPDVPALSWRLEVHKIGFWPDRIAVDSLETREQAEEVVARLVAMVNGIWDRRSEIEPDNSPHENLQPLELYRLTPRTNCKVCGESTCFNFALKLAAGQLESAKCIPLFQEERYKDRRAVLEGLLARKRPLL
jgi:ArsR family metal-binding transcriptional regulator